MKFLKFVSILLMISVFSVLYNLDIAIAQQRLKPAKSQNEYICTECNRKGFAPGKCVHDGTELSKITTTYVCEECGISQDIFGNCPKCGMPLKAVKKAGDKVIEEFTCKHCGRKLTVVNPSSKCNVCGCGRLAGECK